MNDKVNGTGPNAQITDARPVSMRRTTIPHGSGQKFVYTMSDGAYLGCIITEAVSLDAMKLMVQDLQDHITTASGGLMVARGPLPKTQ